jgi:hypothetical protein
MYFDKGWKQVWHKGIAPQISLAGLQALHQALSSNDDRLIQHDTVRHKTSTAGVIGACAIGYCGWQGLSLERSYEILGYFRNISDKCALNGEKIADFLEWFDSNDRAEVFAALLAEVSISIADRLEHLQILYNEEVCHA